MSSTQIQKLSLLLENCNYTKPIELHRAIRGIKHLRHWKGSEYRTFLLYTGIVVLRDVIPTAVYENFLYLFCATFILSSDYFSNYFQIAHELLCDFIRGFQTVYGKDAISSNFHNLCHVVGDVNKFGSLPNISSYEFENYLGHLKSLLRHGNKPLSQICNRIIEMVGVNKSKSAKVYPTLENEIANSMFRTVCLSDFFSLKGDNKNNWFLTKHSEIVSMISANMVEGTINILGEEIKEKFDFFNSPIPSSRLFIFQAKLVYKKARLFNVLEIKCKLFAIKNHSDMIFVPVLHTIRK